MGRTRTGEYAVRDFGEDGESPGAETGGDGGRAGRKSGGLVHGEGLNGWNAGSDVLEVYISCIRGSGRANIH